jgi:hypothetical protein
MLQPASKVIKSFFSLSFDNLYDVKDNQIEGVISQLKKVWAV